MRFARALVSSILTSLLSACGTLPRGEAEALEAYRGLDFRAFLEKAFGSGHVSADGHLVTGSAWFTGSGAGALGIFSDRFKAYCNGNGATYRPLGLADTALLAQFNNPTPLLQEQRPLGYFQSSNYHELLELIPNKQAIYGGHEQSFREAISHGAFGDFACVGPGDGVRWGVRILPVEYQRTRRYSEGGAIIQAAVVDPVHR